MERSKATMKMKMKTKMKMKIKMKMKLKMKMEMEMKMKMDITALVTPFTALLSCYILGNALLRYVMIQAYCWHTDFLSYYTF